MALRLGQTYLFLLLLSGAVSAAPNIVQSLVVDFPVNGRVIVQAHEEPGRFPQMLFVSEKTSKVLLLSSIQDTNKWLIPEESDPVEARSNLRFRVIRSAGFSGPMVMSVGLFPGGSDDAYFLRTVFGEADGRILRFKARIRCESLG